jgi:hypothetical protein
VLSLPLLAATGAWLTTGQSAAPTELSGGAHTAGSTFESGAAEGWRARDGRISTTRTRTAPERRGLVVHGRASHRYDTTNSIDARQVVSVRVASGRATVAVAVDGTRVAAASDNDTVRLSVPDGEQVTVTIEGEGCVVEAVAVHTAPHGERL